MALDSGIDGTRGDRQSHDREPSSASSLPALGTAAAVALGRALDTRPARNEDRHQGGRYYRMAAEPLRRLRALTELRAVLEQLEAVDVAEAMRAGARWEDVGRELGSSRSAAHRKHGAERWHRESRA